MVVYVFSVILLFFCLFMAPHTMCIKIDYEYKESRETLDKKNYLILKLFGIFPIAKIYLSKRIDKIFKQGYIEKYVSAQKQKNMKLKEVFSIENLLLNMLKDIKYKKVILSLGFNINEYIINSYINASINTIICMYININQEKFNLSKLYYEVYISKSSLKIYFDCIISINFAKTIKEILKKYISKKRLEKRRSVYYGRTSD